MRRFSRLVALLALLIAAQAGTTLVAAAGGSSSRSGFRPAASSVAAPKQLQIAGIGLNETLMPVGLDASRRPIVPMHNVGWYIHSARPGQGDNVVMWGHVLRFRATPRIPAPFERLATLKTGAAIKVVAEDGKVYRYRVTKTVWARPSDIQYILPTGKEQLTLVSCIGDKVIVRGQLTKKYRLITIAEPIS
jgi:LPXTG-site transpeptidase (sortase) family protein